MRTFATLACLCGLIVTGCGPRNASFAQPGVGDAKDTSAVTRASMSTVDEVASAAPAPEDLILFVPAGATLVDSVQGDLTGHGSSDALIVFASASSGRERLGEGPARTIVLMKRDARGRLQQAAENARIVPCARCGGIAGDPYGYARIEGGTFTVAVSGGSRERWFSDYVFRYAAEHGTWQLDRVVRGVTDTQTGVQKHAELTAVDLGQVEFSQFDPETLPAAPALD